MSTTNTDPWHCGRYRLDGTTEHVASPRLVKACMNRYDDVLDVSLVDWELLTEVELLTDVMLGAQAVDRTLTLEEIDRVLGISASPSPLGRLTARRHR